MFVFSQGFLHSKSFLGFLGNSGILDREHSTQKEVGGNVMPVVEESIYAARKRMRMEL